MDFNLVNLVVTVQTANSAILLKWLHNIGCELSAICKSGVCRWPARVCEICSSRESCSWYLVFGQRLTVDPFALKRHQKPPLPFVFSFPAPDDLCKNTDLVECGLVLIGRAIPHLEMLLEGFTELLADDTCPTPAEVVLVASRDYQRNLQTVGAGSSITQPDELAVLSTEGLLQIYPWECIDLGIRLLSPLRLLEGGHPLSRFDFSCFARSVMRRVSSLAYYYGGCEIDSDFKFLSIQTGKVACVEDHFFHETCMSRKRTGMTGYGNFHGDFIGLMPFLVLGMYLHVGKGAAFGMGRYELISGIH